MATQSIAVFSIKNNRLCVRYVKDDNANIGVASYVSNFPADNFNAGADFVWHADSGRFYGLMVFNDRPKVGFWENYQTDYQYRSFTALLTLGSDLRLSLLSRLPLRINTDTPKFCSLLLTNGVLNAAVHSGNRPFTSLKEANQIQNDGDKEAGFCVHVTEQTKITESPPFDQRQNEDYKQKITYSNLFAFRAFRTSEDRGSSNNWDRLWNQGYIFGLSKDRWPPSQLIRLSNSGKVYAVRYDDVDRGIMLYTMPLYGFERLSTSTDYLWSPIRIVSKSGKQTYDGTTIAVQGKDSKSAPRLYSFFIDPSKDIWVFYIPLQGINRVYGELDIPLGATEYNPKDLGLLGDAIPNRSGGKIQADRDVPMKAVQYQDSIALFYSWQGRPAWVKVRLNNDASFAALVRWENISKENERMVGACLIPSAIAP